MTERLYEEDAYCRSFTAVVAECLEEGESKGFAVRLDRTAFYPEGGGQSGDTGILTVQAETGMKRCKVLDTQESAGEVWHFTDTPLTPGSFVEGQIDWEARFDRMQNHTGEHIVSGLIHAIYGYRNVGFHMGSDCMTIDLSGELSMEQLTDIEMKANEVVWQNTKISVERCTEEEAAHREYRSKKELHGIVRLVEIPNADVCACCGTHVRRTGEIGLIRILSAEKFRGGSRVEMLCGRRAYLYDTALYAQNRKISAALSAKPLETAEAVLRTKNMLSEATYRSIGLEQKLFQRTAQKLAGSGDVLILSETMAPDSVRRLAVAVMEFCGGICAVFAGDSENGYKYAIGETGGDLRSFVKEMNAALDGRGGGKPFFAQGSVGAGEERIRDYFLSQAERQWKTEIY